MLTRARSRSSSMEESGEETSSQQEMNSQDSAPLSMVGEKPAKKRKSPKKKASNKPTTQIKANQWVVILPESALAETRNDPIAKPLLVSVTHKKTDSTQRYLLSPDKHTLCEINKCTDKHRSWFINDTLQTDGSLHICTPVDPLFLSLNIMLSRSDGGKLSMFMPLESLLESSDYDSSINMEDLVEEEQWKNICEVKEVSGEKVYRYSKDRTLGWLAKKVTALSAELQSECVYVGSGSQTSGYVRGKKDTSITVEEYYHYAAGMIGDYLPTSLRELLLSKYPTTIAHTSKRKIETDQENGPSTKKKTKTSGPTEDYSKLIPIQPISKNNPTKLTAAQKSLAKVNKKGMKSLTSFFK